MFLISLTSLIVLSTAFYRIAGRQRKTSLFYDTSKYFYAYIEVLFFEATKVKFVPQANRILLAVWLIACLILINLFNGEVKANLLVKSDTERINTAEDVLRHPKLLPLTMKNSPLTTALQISSMESVRRLWDRMAAMGGAIPVPEVFTAKSLQMVQQRKAVIATDMMTGRVQSSLFCPVLDGFFYVGTQSITNLRSVWYYRKRIDPDLVKAINKRILWLFESGVPFMRNQDLYPKGSTCFLDTSKQDRSGSFQPLTAQDMRAVFMLSGYLMAMACVFLLVELIAHGMYRILWVFQSPFSLLRYHELFPKGSTCLLDTHKQDRSSSFQPLSFRDMRAVFILTGFLFALAFVFLFIELIVCGLYRCTDCIAGETDVDTC
ncbi:hypothetical protein IscW_ISCW019302 [Ixodes scapularis]|uniref:Ionotropic glutamate receptor C-terminal domain-containing protein n=1 Tax=Ixodes scapularis TaxID=6945 RepID=B7PWR8_IXOSC|nr:hypothetical protein IscW_ISCW019302 [Ixodes scapularis]|eukprot:XP_002410215.1 hypothetical protein IscW_ISCW019302 [Ixodes scapularis]